MEFYAVVAFLFGLAIGSFLNVVVFRYNTGLTVSGRSMCFSCGKEIPWYALIPVLSYILMRGKCVFCRAKVSIQYPAVEIITGLIFAAVFLKEWGSGLPILLTALFGFSLLIAIAVYDMRHKIIPDGLVYAWIISTYAYSAEKFYISGDLSENFFFIAFGGAVTALPIVLLFIVSRGRWIGFGDAKIAIGMGFMFGPFLGISSLVIAFWTGAIYGLSVLAFQRLSRLPESGKILKMKSEIPFGPFLILATLFIYFFPVDVLGLSNLFANYFFL